MFKSFIVFFLTLNIVCCAACSTAKTSVKTELYFGLCKNDTCLAESDFISESEWQEFVNKFVMPRFPGGLTVIEANGQWENSQSGKLIREKTKILVLLHKQSPVDEESIESIRNSYKKLFGQESVMKVNSKIDLSF